MSRLDKQLALRCWDALVDVDGEHPQCIGSLAVETPSGPGIDYSAPAVWGWMWTDLRRRGVLIRMDTRTEPPAVKVLRRDGAGRWHLTQWQEEEGKAVARAWLAVVEGGAAMKAGGNTSERHYLEPGCDCGEGRYLEPGCDDCDQ